jgi:ADP-heptose:LPS heptosyltransferase
MNMSWKLDCRHFIGDRPCKFKRVCEGCAQYDPMGKRILIVKLAAIGDVLRTTPLLSGLKRAYPQSHVTWIVDREAAPLLKSNPLIDRLWVFDFAALLPLDLETFELVLGLEKEPRGAALASKARGGEKRGFGLGPEGNLFPLNRASEYAFALGISDDLKFRHNQKTYPQIIFEMAELDYENDEYLFFLTRDDEGFAEDFVRRKKLQGNKTFIGLNTGAGEVFANKAWPEERFLQLIKALGRDPKLRLLLLGGPVERERNRRILQKARGTVIDAGCENTLGQFTALVRLCDVVVTADTTALHLAIGLKKKVVALFGPTCAQEIELYGRGVKVVSPLSCAPCYRRRCEISPNCMEAIPAEEVVKRVREMLPASRKTRKN